MTIENNNGKAIGLDKLGYAGLLIGVLSALWLGYSIAQDAKAALPSYLFGYIFWFGMTIGCAGLVLLHHTVRGAWGLAILRLIEAGSSVGNLFLMTLLSAPILMNLPKIYEWAEPAFKEHGSPFMNFKFAWLTDGFFMARILGYFVILGLYMYAMRKSSLKQDETRDENLAQTRTNWAAPGILVFCITVTLAFTDLTMSLDPHWFSHIWGFINIAGSTLSVFAFCNLLVMSNSKRLPYSEIMNKGLSKDLGNWMFVFTCLWAYFSFSQYVIIYAGNMPEFTSFFLARRDPTWGALGLGLMFGSFLLPFVILLSPRVKATPSWLVRVAIWILVFRVLDAYWTVIPFFRSTLKFDPNDLIAFLAVGGLWLFGFSRAATQGALVPTHDPRVKEAYEHA